MSIKMTLAAVASLVALAGCSQGPTTTGPSTRPPAAPPPMPPTQPPEMTNNAPSLPQGQIAPGALNGSWLVRRSDSNALLFYLDLVHDEGEPTLVGDFLVAEGYSTYYEGRSGPVGEASVSETELELAFNPTAQIQDESLTLTASWSANAWQGELVSARTGPVAQVRLERRNR